MDTLTTQHITKEEVLRMVTGIGRRYELDLETPEGRFALRAMAYWLLPSQPEEAERIFERVGKEG